MIIIEIYAITTTNLNNNERTNINKVNGITEKQQQQQRKNKLITIIISKSNRID